MIKWFFNLFKKKKEKKLNFFQILAEENKNDEITFSAIFQIQINNANIN